jgi:hypothetical protein
MKKLFLILATLSRITALGIMLWLFLANSAFASTTEVKHMAQTASTVDVNGMNIEYKDAQTVKFEDLDKDGNLTEEAQKKIDEEEQARISRWQEAIKHPTPISKEDLQKQQAELDARIAELQDVSYIQAEITKLSSQKQEVATQISAIVEDKVIDGNEGILEEGIQTP